MGGAAAAAGTTGDDRGAGEAKEEVRGRLRNEAANAPRSDCFPCDKVRKKGQLTLTGDGWSVQWGEARIAVRGRPVLSGPARGELGRPARSYADRQGRIRLTGNWICRPVRSSGDRPN